jgi:uncharacterized protein
MDVVDGHSHLFQNFASSGHLKRSVKEVEGFDMRHLLKLLDEAGVSQVQVEPQEMTRVMGQWLGSNELSADVQRSAPDRIVGYAAAEPLDPQGGFNRARLEEVREMITERGLKGLLLTPPYGHYYSNDKRVYPFYEMATELDVPIYFHHSHMFMPPKLCPLKYARIWHLDDLTIDFPDLRFNVEHMGYPWTEELLSIMARSPNVYSDTAEYVTPDPTYPNRPLLLARNLGMAREYGVLDRIFYGSDYVGENIDEYVRLLKYEIGWIKENLNVHMEKLGFPPLSQEEMEGLLGKNVRALWKGRRSNVPTWALVETYAISEPCRQRTD